MTKTKQFLLAFLLLATIYLSISAHENRGPWDGTLFAGFAGLAGMWFVMIIAPVTVKTVKVPVQDARKQR